MTRRRRDIIMALVLVAATVGVFLYGQFAYGCPIPPEVIDSLQNYEWGNSYEWLIWYCDGTGRIDCWT